MQRRTPALVRAVRSSSDKPIVTYTLIGINLLVYLLQWVTNGWLVQNLIYVPILTANDPWRMITTTFLHSQSFLLHIVFNMYSLYVLGPSLESFLGRARYLALYLIAGFGGSVAVLYFGAPTVPVLGASGAIFGLLGAHFIVQRRLGGNTTQLIIVIVINLAIGFIVPNVAWQAHVGGLIVGGAIAAIYLRMRNAKSRAPQALLVVAVAISLVAATAVKVVFF